MIKGTTPGKCIFCEQPVTNKNSQGLDTCNKCKNKLFVADKCPICKAWLDEQTGKYGTYYVCPMHGNWSSKRLSQLGAGHELPKTI